MRLELLTPVSWEHPVKVFLEAWYIRLAMLGHTEPLGLMYPHLVDELATEDFTVWLKSGPADSAHRVPRTSERLTNRAPTHRAAMGIRDYDAGMHDRFQRLHRRGK